METIKKYKCQFDSDIDLSVTTQDNGSTVISIADYGLKAGANSTLSINQIEDLRDFLTTIIDTNKLLIN